MVLFVVYETLTGKFLNSLVTNLVSFTVYVNLAHLCASFLSCFFLYVWFCCYCLGLRVHTCCCTQSVLRCYILVPYRACSIGNYSFYYARNVLRRVCALVGDRSR